MTDTEMQSFFFGSKGKSHKPRYKGQQKVGKQGSIRTSPSEPPEGLSPANIMSVTPQDCAQTSNL